MGLGLGLRLGLGGAGVLGPALDPDAENYIGRVQIADGQDLEASTRLAYDAFFRGIKTDGDFAKLKASCILAGARTLAGALVPLVAGMPAPTNVGFVAGDYSRALGLKGNGSSKYLLSNRTTNDDPLNNYHLLIYFTEADTTTSAIYAGAGGTGNAQLHYGYNTETELFSRSKNDAVDFITTSGPRTGLIGISRNDPGNYTFYHSNTAITISRATEANPNALNIAIFGRNLINTIDRFSNGRILFYSSGEAISTNLRLRLNTLVTALATL